MSHRAWFRGPLTVSLLLRVSLILRIKRWLIVSDISDIQRASQVSPSGSILSQLPQTNDFKTAKTFSIFRDHLDQEQCRTTCESYMANCHTSICVRAAISPVRSPLDALRRTVTVAPNTSNNIVRIQQCQSDGPEQEIHGDLSLLNDQVSVTPTGCKSLLDWIWMKTMCTTQTTADQSLQSHLCLYLRRLGLDEQITWSVQTALWFSRKQH